MKRRLNIVFFLATLCCSVATAQWKMDSDGLGVYDSVTAFGVHNGILFCSASGVIAARNPSTGKWGGRPSIGFNWKPGGVPVEVCAFANVERYFFLGTCYLPEHRPTLCYRSSDSGTHWEAVEGQLQGTNGKYIFASSPTSVYRSRDTGNSFQAVPCPAARTFACSGANIVASVSDGIQFSKDSGSTWTKGDYPSSLPSPSSFVVVGSTVFASANAGATGIAYSSDSGAHWQALPFQHWVNTFVTDGQNLFAGTKDSGIYVSSDMGLSWHSFSDGMGHWLNVQSMIIWDTFLVINATAVERDDKRPNFNGMRPLSEMVPPRSAVVQSLPPNDTLAIYPNPSLGSIMIRSTYEIQQISLLNILGAKVMEIPNGRQSEVTLDVSRLPSGSYFLQIQTAKGLVIRKIEKE